MGICLSDKKEAGSLGYMEGVIEMMKFGVYLIERKGIFKRRMYSLWIECPISCREFWSTYEREWTRKIGSWDSEGTLKIEVIDVRNVIPDITDKYVFVVKGSQYQQKWGNQEDGML